MNKSQRILVAIVLPTFAFILHMLFCDWFLLNRGRTSNELLVFDGRGLFMEGSTTHLSAVMLGIVVPVALLAIDGFLLLGWRHQKRIAQGQCPECGYDLRGSAKRVCPECGAEVQTQ